MKLLIKSTKQVRCGFGGTRDVSILKTVYFVDMCDRNQQNNITTVCGYTVNKCDIIGEIIDESPRVYTQRQLKAMIGNSKKLREFKL